MRMSKVNRRVAFKHNNLDDFRDKVATIAETLSVKATLFVAVEALYSMDGDAPDLLSMLACLRELLHDRFHVILDEVRFLLVPNKRNKTQVIQNRLKAHSTGLFGPKGKGLAHLLNCTTGISIRLHTFGKAFSCGGAVVLCSPVIRSFVCLIFFLLSDLRHLQQICLT